MVVTEMFSATAGSGTQFTVEEVASIHAVVAQLPIAAVVFSLESSVIAANDECRQLLGYDSDDLTGAPVTDLLPDSGSATLQFDPCGRTNPAGGLRRLRRSDGTHVSCWLHLGAGILAGRRVVIACMDLVSPMVHETDLWRTRAERDDLTGLYRRSAFLDHVNRWIADDRTLILAFIDVDDLKHINDTHGHSAGDCVLQAVAHRLLNWLPPGALAGRFAGDEFVLALSAVDASYTIEGLCTGLRDHLCGELVAWRGGSLFLSVSIGAVIGASGEDGAPLVARADEQMYAAKAAAHLARGRRSEAPTR